MTIKAVKNAPLVFRFRLNEARWIKSVTADGAVTRWQTLDSIMVEVALPKPHTAGSVFELRIRNH
jgi:hypothetical protein